MSQVAHQNSRKDNIYPTMRPRRDSHVSLVSDCSDWIIISIALTSIFIQCSWFNWCMVSIFTIGLKIMNFAIIFIPTSSLASFKRPWPLKRISSSIILVVLLLAVSSGRTGTELTWWSTSSYSTWFWRVTKRSACSLTSFWPARLNFVSSNFGEISASLTLNCIRIKACRG